MASMSSGSIASTFGAYHTPLSNEDHVDAAVQAVNQAQRAWAARAPAARAAVCESIADRVQREAELLSYAEALDTGKPLADARSDIADVELTWRWAAEAALSFDTGPTPAPLLRHVASDWQCSLRYVPRGTVGIITPFNFPLMIASWGMAPALAAGCGVVIKPHDATPTSALLLEAIIADAMHGEESPVRAICGGALPGAALVMHPDIHQLVFTGSNATAQKIQAANATRPRMIPHTYELGGKSAAIVLEDAMSTAETRERVLDDLAYGAWAVSGQVCSATSRVIAVRSAYDAVVDGLRARAQNWNAGIGHPLAAGARMGPLLASPLLAAFPEDVLSKEAGCVAGGAPPSAVLDEPGSLVAPPSHLNYYQATVLAGRDSPALDYAWTHELFAPVASVVPAADEAEAVRLANDTPYGLAAAVFSADADAAQHVASQLSAGTVWMNANQVVPQGAPWSGWGCSGLGSALGPSALHKYLQTQAMTRPR